MDGREDFHASAQRLLDLFVSTAESQYAGAPVPPAALRALARSLLSAPPMTRFLNAEYERLTSAFDLELKRRRRADPLQRLVTHPLSEVFQTGLLSRDILPNWFSYLHLVMGDDRVLLSERCMDIMADIREVWPDEFPWDHFYEDPRAKHVLWSVLVRIAESFRRFELRREWFINLMQYAPQAVSLAPTAFLPRAVEEQPQGHAPFGIDAFNILFAALFTPMLALTPTDQALFRQQTGVDSHKIFGPLCQKLGMAGALQ